MPSEIFRISNTNTAALTFGASTAARWATGRLRVRMTDSEREKYGALNCLRVLNKSSKKVRIHFTWGIDNDSFEDIEGPSIRNITLEDGRRFYGFDIENLDTAADIAIGDIQYFASKVV
jgi:hypothetical protein